MIFYVIRHGETEWNKLKVMQGQTDIPLNSNGLEQARQIGHKIKDIDFDIAFCSPLQRAKQTLDNLDVKCPVIVDERLKERNYGEFEKTLKSSFDYNAFWDYTKKIKYKKAEDVETFLKRVSSFIQEIEQNSYKNVLIVTHAGVVKAFGWYFEGLSGNEMGPFLPKNTEMLIFNSADKKEKYEIQQNSQNGHI